MVAHFIIVTLSALAWPQASCSRVQTSLNEYTTTATTTAAPPTTATTRPAPSAPPATPRSQPPRNLSLFCFAWTPQRGQDNALLPYAEELYRGCDGHLFFTDEEAPRTASEEGFVRVRVPKSRRPRSAPDWLFHQNMIGLAPALQYLLDRGIAEQYDWVLNSELDHFMDPSRARRCVEDYLDILRRGTASERRSADGALLLMWGNVFVFNRELVKLLKPRWGELARPIEDDKMARGCPELSRKWAKLAKGGCEQDMIFPLIPTHLNLPGHVASYGPKGCGHQTTSAKNVPFPVACWQHTPNIFKPLTWNEKEARRSIGDIARMRRLPNWSAAMKHCKKVGRATNSCQSLWYARETPVIHNIKTPDMHRYARKVLLP